MAGETYTDQYQGHTCMPCPNVLNYMPHLVSLVPEFYALNIDVQLNGWWCWLIALEPYTPDLG
jgi:hypothetical protein